MLSIHPSTKAIIHKYIIHLSSDVSVIYNTVVILVDAVLRFSRLALLLDDTRIDQSNIALQYSRTFIGTGDIFILSTNPTTEAFAGMDKLYYPI